MAATKKSRKPASKATQAAKKSATTTVPAKRGAPAKYASPDAMQAAIDRYFSSPTCDFTITGLALALGFESRQSLYDYRERGDFSCTVKTALLRVENKYEQRLLDGGAGPIFALKNMGWKDKQEISGADGGPLEVVVTVIEPNRRKA